MGCKRNLYAGVQMLVTTRLAPVVQTLGSAIHRINRYPVDKYQGHQLRYPLDRGLSAGQHYPIFEQLGPGRIMSVTEGFSTLKRI